MRRSISLTLIAVTLACQVEAVVGEVRDAEVHHESTSEAWIHAHDMHGPHAHDDAEHGGEHVASRGDNHDRADHDGHEHGTRADHCSHVHGVALVCGMSFTFETSAVAAFAFEAPSALLDTPSEILSPPPQA